MVGLRGADAVKGREKRKEWETETDRQTEKMRERIESES